MINIQENKERFLSLLKNTPLLNMLSGTNEIIHYLDESDFFITPASINYHGNYEGGLCEHCLQVYDNILKIAEVYNCEYTEKELTFISLFHDVCKIGIYKKEWKSVKRKNEDGTFVYNEKGKNVWDEKEGYTIDDSLPLGHGEKSVILLSRFYTMTNNEIMAIRWHMGGYDDITKSHIGNLTANKAFNLYPIITLLHMADLASIFLQLKENKNEMESVSLDLDSSR